MKRILVIGTSGSGKSALARKLSDYLGLPFFASDHFYWESNWKAASSKKVRQQILDVICREAWVLDGNFDSEHDWAWKRADCIVWLDYPLRTILKRVVLRNFRWVLTQQTTWAGNRMTFQRAISGIRHTVKTYFQKKQEYPRWLAECSSIMCYRFSTSHETDKWLQSLKPQIVQNS